MRKKQDKKGACDSWLRADPDAVREICQKFDIKSDQLECIFQFLEDDIRGCLSPSDSPIFSKPATAAILALENSLEGIRNLARNDYDQVIGVMDTLFPRPEMADSKLGWAIFDCLVSGVDRPVKGRPSDSHDGAGVAAWMVRYWDEIAEKPLSTGKSVRSPFQFYKRILPMLYVSRAEGGVYDTAAITRAALSDWVRAVRRYIRSPPPDH